MHWRYMHKANFYSGIYTSLIYVIYFIITKNNSNLRNLCINSIIAIFSAILVTLWKSKKITGGLLYCICLIFMHLGQVVIVAFNMKFTQQLKSSIAIGETITNSSQAVRFSTLACLLTLIIVCFIENNTNENDYITANLRLNYHIRFKPIAKIFVIFITTLTIIGDLIRVVNVATVGYGAGYKQTSTVLFYADMIFTICVFLLISVYKNNYKFLRNLMLFVIMRAIVSAFFIGARSDAVLNIIMCVFAIRKLSTSAEIKNRVTRLFIWILIIGIIALPFTGIARNNSSLTLSSFFKEYNPISYSLTEFGGTIINVCNGIAQYRKLPLSDFFNSFLSIIPMSTILFPGLVTNYGGSYAAYLNTIYHGGYGGSIIGESAFWFGDGSLGLIFVMVISLIVVICMNILEKKRIKNDIASNTAILFLLYEMFYYIRGSVSDFQAGIKLAIYFYIIIKFTRKYLFTDINKENI